MKYPVSLNSANHRASFDTYNIEYLHAFAPFQAFLGRSILQAKFREKKELLLKLETLIAYRSI